MNQGLGEAYEVGVTVEPPREGSAERDRSIVLRYEGGCKLLELHDIPDSCDDWELDM